MVCNGIERPENVLSFGDWTSYGLVGETQNGPYGCSGVAYR